MHGLFISVALVCWLVLELPAKAATGRVIKVLPYFLDAEGRKAISPSLYDRDAYQFYLRQHPEKRSAIRFDVQWKTKGQFSAQPTLRVELRGSAQGDLPKTLSLERPVEPRGWFSHWSGLSLSSGAC